MNALNSAADLEARARRQAAGAASLAEFRMDSCRPFGSTVGDMPGDFLAQAHALTVALSIAIGDAEDTPLRNVHATRALDAIATLVALAEFTRGAAA